jgi:hypothetical protein
MTTRLFHTIVICGAALAMPTLGCGSDTDDGTVAEGLTDGGAERESIHERRCRLSDGGCHEHCTAVPGGGCLDPCFLHTESCSPDCLLLDGTCGWPPTK